MRKIFRYILITIAVVVTASCSNELDEALQPAHNGKLQFVVSDFPAFGESPDTRASQIGTPDEGKTAWVRGDEIIVELYSSEYKFQYARLNYDGSEWKLYGRLSYLESETPSVRAYYAPCYDVDVLKPGMLEGMTEYLEDRNCQVVNSTISISLDYRNYSRLRIAATSNAMLTIYTTGFVPAGTSKSANKPYFITADDKGNAYLYGVFIEGATVTVNEDEETLVSYRFTEKTKNGKSYALDARPVMDGTLGGKTTASKSDVNDLF